MSLKAQGATIKTGLDKKELPGPAEGEEIIVCERKRGQPKPSGRERNKLKGEGC